jgi:hypothetical protein
MFKFFQSVFSFIYFKCLTLFNFIFKKDNLEDINNNEDYIIIDKLNNFVFKHNGKYYSKFSYLPFINEQFELYFDSNYMLRKLSLIIKWYKTKKLDIYFLNDMINEKDKIIKVINIIIFYRNSEKLKFTFFEINYIDEVILNLSKIFNFKYKLSRELLVNKKTLFELEKLNEIEYYKKYICHKGSKII